MFYICDKDGLAIYAEVSISRGRVTVVGDTCTGDASLFLAIDAVEVAGCKVVKIISILDRRENCSDEI